MSYGVFRKYPYQYPRPVFIPTVAPSGNIYTGTFTLGKVLGVANTPLIPWIYGQLFNDLSDGDLNGQDGWVQVSGLVSVGDYTPYEGAKSLQTVAPSPAPVQQYYRDLSDYDYGTFYFAIRGGQPTGSVAYISIGNPINAPTYHGQIRFSASTGKIFIYDYGSDWVEIANWSADTWYVIGVYFDCTSNIYRINVNDGAWSSDYDMLNGGSVNRITLSFYGGTSASNTWQFDTISLTYIGPTYSNSLGLGNILGLSNSSQFISSSNIALEDILELSGTSQLSGTSTLSLDKNLSLTNTSQLTGIGSFDLSKSLGITSSGSLLLGGSITLGKILTSQFALVTSIADIILSFGGNTYAGNITLDRIDGLSSTSQLSSTNTLSLGKILSLSDISQFAGIGNINLSISNAFNGLSGLAVVGSLSLEKILDYANSGALVLIGNINLEDILVLSDTSQLSSTNTLSLSNILSLSSSSQFIGIGNISLPIYLAISESGGLLLLGSIPLGKILDFTDSSTIGITGNISLGSILGLINSSLVSSLNTIDLSKFLSITSQSQLDGINSLELSKILDLVTSGNIVVTVTITLDNILALTTSGQIITGALVYQYSFRWRNDDGDEASATWKEDLNIDAFVNKETTIRLRVLLNTSGNLDPSLFQLEYRKVGEADWKIVQS